MKALYMGIWAICFGTIIAANLFVHRHHTRLMREEVRSFEAKWRQLEGRYGQA